jgi:hypothetical protein
MTRESQMSASSNIVFTHAELPQKDAVVVRNEDAMPLFTPGKEYTRLDNQSQLVQLQEV